MSDYLSKYRGEEIDERLERVDYLVPKSVIVNDFLNGETDHVASAWLSKQLKASVDELFLRFVTNDTNQTIQGAKTFQDPAVFSSGITVPSGQEIIIVADPTDPRGVVAKQYMDKRAVDTNVAGRGLKFLAGAGNTPNSIEIELDTRSGLKFSTEGVEGKLRVDINGAVEVGSADLNDEIMIHSASTGQLVKIKKSAFLGGLTKSLRLRGTWDPTTNTVIGDTLNASLSKTAAPIPPPGDTSDGYQYIVSSDGSYDLLGSATVEEFYTGDSVVWSGTEWVLVRDQSKVLSFKGAAGTARQGEVEAAYGDYNADMIPYNRPDGGKADIQSSSDNVEAAITDLDDRKVSRNFPVFAGTVKFQDGVSGDMAYSFTSDPTTGAYFYGGEVVYQVANQPIHLTNQTGLKTFPGKYISLNGKGHLVDVEEAGTFHILMAATNEARVRGVQVRLRAVDNSDMLIANSSSVSLRASNTTILNVDVAKVTLNKPLSAPIGTASAPGIYFGGDQATGFFSPANDRVGVAVAGIELARFRPNSVVFYSDIHLSPDGTPGVRMKYLADPEDVLDAVNKQSLDAAINSTYRPDVIASISVSTAMATIPAAAIDGAKYLVCAKSDSGARSVVEVLMTHDGVSNVYVSEYGQVGPDLVTISFVVSGSNIIMNVAPNSGTVTVKVKTVALL